MKNRTDSAKRPIWPEGAGAPLVSPLQMSAAYPASDPDALDAIYEGRAVGYTYAREGHPNAHVLARMIDGLEGRDGGIVTGSGMAAIGAVFLAALKAGDHVIGGDQLYGRSLRLLNEDLPRMGVECTLADGCDAQTIKAALRPNTRLILIEVVANPTIRIADVDGISKLAKERGILLAIDNTFTTPLGFNPWEAGADFVIHSVTKLLAGHSDVTLGYAAARASELTDRLNEAIATWGMTPSPFDCWLAERGVMSFALRYEKASANAAALADALAEMKGVRRVFYPTRPDHPDAGRVSILSGQGGNMVSFEIEGDRSAAVQLTRAANSIAFAPTLGDINTTLSHPPSSSHRGMDADRRLALGITEGFFRVSVGIENIDDLIKTFDQAVRASQL
jgi:cystathionine gamma-synthase